MKICIETGDRDACLRPQAKEDDSFIVLLMALAMIGLLPVFILSILISIHVPDYAPLVFAVLVLIDLAVAFHLTWKCRQNYIKEHGESA